MFPGPELINQQLFHICLICLVLLCFALFFWGFSIHWRLAWRFQPALFRQDWVGVLFVCLLGPGGIDRFAFLADPDDFTYIFTVTYLYYTILYYIDYTIGSLYMNGTRSR